MYMPVVYAAESTRSSSSITRTSVRRGIVNSMTNSELFQYLRGRRDVKSVIFEVGPHPEQDNYVVLCKIDCVRGGREFYLSELADNRESRVRHSLSSFIQGALNQYI